MGYILNNTAIFYNNLQVLPGMPAPAITVTEEAIEIGGNNWGTKRKIILSGEVNMNNAGEFENIQRYLLTVFCKNYSTFYIYDNYGLSNQVTTLQSNQTYVSSIDFPESKYLGIGKYIVTLIAYPPDFFQTVGILSAKDEWNFEENGDYILSITRTCSAIGVATTTNPNNSYSNAVSFVTNSVNYGSNNPYNFNNPTVPQISNVISAPINITIVPQFISNQSKALGFVPYLVSAVETSDTTRGEYSVVLTYKADLFYNQLGILRYRINDVDYFDKFKEVTIEGDYIGSRAATFASLRQAFQSYNFLNAALTKEPTLNPTTLEKSVVENQLTKTIKFSFKWNTDQSPLIIQDINTSVSANIDQIKISVAGEVKSKKASTAAWVQVTGAFSGINTYNIATQEYIQFFPSGTNYPLAPTPESKSISENILTNVLNFNYVYNNNDPPSTDFEIMSIRKDVNVPVKIVKPQLTLSMSYYFVDVGIDTPRQVKLSLDARAQESTIEASDLIELSGILSSYQEYGGQLEENVEGYTNEQNYRMAQSFIFPGPAVLTQFSGISL